MCEQKPLIKTLNLKKEYRVGTTVISALKGVSFEIYQKQFCMLCGPSGSGKTTLLNLIGVIDRPTEGAVLLEKIDVAKLSKAKLSEFRLRNIGFVFQRFYLLEELTAVENVFLPAVAKDGFSQDILKRSRYLLNLVGLSKRLNHKPRQLSEGERQRVAVARSLINQPKILLCDEPTATLDAESGKIILDLLAKINSQRDVTIFLVTHDERQLTYADKVFRIADGKIIK